MQNAKTDRNQAEIVHAIRQLGATVQSLAPVGKGVPDLLVGYRGVNFLFEVKGQNGKLTEPQVKWHGEWQGKVYIVRTIEDAITILTTQVIVWGMPKD